MLSEQEMLRHLPRAEALEQMLIEGLAEVIRRDIPTEKFDLFYIHFPIGSDSLIRAAPVLCEKFEGTTAKEWVKASAYISSDEEMARNIAIRRFLSDQTPLDILADEQGDNSFEFAANSGYRLTTQISQGLGQDTFWISLTPDRTAD